MLDLTDRSLEFSTVFLLEGLSAAQKRAMTAAYADWPVDEKWKFWKSDVSRWGDLSRKDQNTAIERVIDFFEECMATPEKRAEVAFVQKGWTEEERKVYDFFWRNVLKYMDQSQRQRFYDAALQGTSKESALEDIEGNLNLPEQVNSN